MKKTIGIIFLVLAVLSGLGAAKALMSGGDSRPTGNRAFDSGRKVGRIVAIATPVVFGVIGLVLLMSSDYQRPVSNAPSGSNKRTLIIVACVAGGILAIVVIGLVGLFVLGWYAHRRPSARTFPPPAAPRSVVPQNAQPPGAPTQTGEYSVGGKVEANWAGKWIPGKITAVNHGGFSVMVALEDSRFPHPILMATNSIRAPR